MSSTTLSWMAIGSVVFGLVAPAWGDDYPVYLDTQPAAQNTPVRSPQIDAVYRAVDPSAVIDAYAQGVAADPKNMGLRKAFVERMIGFGLPGLAERQARELAADNPQEGLAWAVLAYGNATKGKLSMAVADIVAAADLAPGNEFVERSVGQILAWYDIVADLSKTPPALKQSIQRLRDHMAAKPAVKETYDEAAAYYRELRDRPNEPAPANGTTTVPSPDDVSVPTQQPTYQVYNYNYGATPDYYSSAFYGTAWPMPDYGSPYYVTYPYYGGYSWPWTPDYFIGGSFVPFGFFGGGIFGFHHRFHDRGDFDGRHGFFNGYRREGRAGSGFNRFNRNGFGFTGGRGIHGGSPGGGPRMFSGAVTAGPRLGSRGGFIGRSPSIGSSNRPGIRAGGTRAPSFGTSFPPSFAGNRRPAVRSFAGSGRSFSGSRSFGGGGHSIGRDGRGGHR